MESLRCTGDVINKVDNVSQYIYSKKQLVEMVKQYEVDAGHVTKQMDINKDKKIKNKFEKIHDEELKNLQNMRDSKIDFHKLRLTVINGIGCDFVQFESTNLGVLGKKGKEDITKLGDEIKITTCKTGEDNFNLRYKIWLVICKIQDL